VQPDGAGERRGNRYPGEPVKHAPNLPPALALSNRTPPTPHQKDGLIQLLLDSRSARPAAQGAFCC
jgi:hypothetical protein